MRNPRERTVAAGTRLFLSTAAGLGMSLGVLGCQRAPLVKREPARDTLAPADFIGGPAGTSPAPRTAGPTPPSVDRQAPAAGALPAYQVTPGAPAGPSSASLPVGEPDLIEAKIGDINGRPIFVGRFLEPLSGRLEAEAQDASMNAWLGFANDQIIRRLNEIVVDELLRAEALETLSDDQKLGLRAFLETVRQDIQSDNLGSREIARRRLREERGLTEEQFLQRTQEATLIRIAVQERIEPRVTVSWRDIEQRYEKDREIYNPPRVARYRVILVLAEQAPEIEAALASGQPFEEVASRDINRQNAAEGGRRDREIETTVADLEVFPNEALNTAATSLREGEVAGPIPVGSSVAWIKLDEILDRSVSLYDAQLEIEQRIRGERTQAELQRFLQRKVAEANVGNLDVMRRRLLAVAAERYAPRDTRR